MQGQDGYIFRRSRTLTGTSAATVTVTAAARGQLKTDRLKLMELRQYRRQIMRFLAGIVVAIALLLFLIANFITVPAVTFAGRGERQPDSQAYAQTIYRYFDEHPFERFGFLLRDPDIEAFLLRAHPEVLAASLQRDWYGGNVQFSLIFRQPLLVWKTGDKQFYVDAQGVAFSYNHFSEPNVQVTDESGIPPDPNGVVASTRFIRFLGQIVNAVNGYEKGRVERVIIPAATRQIDLKLEGREYIIKTNTDRDPLQQAEDIANALTYFDAHRIVPQYIDVRVAHKAFYQ